jgi:hypothetical protein
MGIKQIAKELQIGIGTVYSVICTMHRAQQSLLGHQNNYLKKHCN